MTRTEFLNISFFWGCWTFFEAVWIAMLWQTRTRVLGNAVYRIPGMKHIRRGACEKRVETLLAALGQQGVPAEGRPDKDELVDRWHRIVAGRCGAVLLQAVPLLLAVLPFWWATSFARTEEGVPFWMCAAVAGFGSVSIALMAADERATTVSDPAGAVTVEAIHFLEALLIPVRHGAQGSALDAHGKQFRRLCNVLRAHARHGTRTMPPAVRESVRDTTERLIMALAEGDQRYLLGGGADRSAAERDLSRLVADVLRHSCRARARRDSLVIVDSQLLANVPETEGAGSSTEPLRSRLLAGAGRLAVAAGLLAGAFLFPGGGEASGLLAVAGVASVAAIWPPLREVLYRGGELLTGRSSTAREPEAMGEEPSHPAPSLPCPRCADRPTATGGSRPAG
ncbi:hypothetical protein ACFXJ6_19385 [Streptomyces sp. NPDC059218]|uniref:hypothetical protein n=1 Tax=unclassified Streptomyces TaxID=2593676 RepID=UPI0036BD9A0C